MIILTVTAFSLFQQASTGKTEEWRKILHSSAAICPPELGLVGSSESKPHLPEDQGGKHKGENGEVLSSFAPQSNVSKDMLAWFTEIG